MELYRKYRPTKLSEVVGQLEAVKVLSKYLRSRTLPHTILFVGPPGTGKTTMARILASRVDTGVMGLVEINCASCDPLATIRNVQEWMQGRPIGGKAWAFIYDEFQSLSRAGFAQQACLKPFEEVPAYVYHFLCSTNPAKIDTAIKSRATEIKTRSLSGDEVRDLLDRVTAAEKMPTFDAARDRIAEMAGGSARAALVLLDKLVGVEPKGQLAVLGKADDAAGDGIELARVLVQPVAPWPLVATVLKRLKDEDPERLRRLVMSYATTVVLGAGKLAPRAMNVLQAFREATFVGFEDIVAMSYDVSSKR